VDLELKRIKELLVWGTGLITVFITPLFSYDALNVPRMTLLVVMASVISLLLASKLRLLSSPNYRPLTVLFGLFVIQLFLVWLIAPANKVQQFFGAGGRQTGLLTYFALAVIWLAAVLVSSTELTKRFVIVLVISGSLSIIYGVIQSLGADPVGWKNPYSPVFGFFGNPNFLSSFMGLSASTLTIFMLNGRIKQLWRGLIGLYIALSFYVIYASKSQQGYLVFASGMILCILVLFFKQRNLFKFRYYVLSTCIIATIAVVMDILQKSPWNSFLYKPSVSNRGDYWRAGWQMSLDNPIFGVGLDSYRDWYFRSRDLVAASRPESSNFTDSAHNVLLDLSANGGFPLLIIYLVLLVVTLVSAFKVLRRMQEFDPFFVAILALWICYLSQSLISINQIALALWGWISSGLIIGYEVNTRDKNLVKNLINTKNQRIQKKTSISLRIAVGATIGLGLGLPPFLADANFRSSIDSGNANNLIATIKRWPQDVTRINFASYLFEKNNLPDYALEAAISGANFSPETFESWKIIYELPNTLPRERAEALVMMKKLNPLAFDFK